jgi:hypothetical protein
LAQKEQQQQRQRFQTYRDFGLRLISLIQ